MKKLVAFACAAALAVTAVVPAIADPSIYTVTDAEPEPVKVENVTGDLAETLAENPDLEVVIVPADAEKVMDAYKEAFAADGTLTPEVEQNIENLGKAIDALQDPTQNNTVQDIVAILTGGTKEEVEPQTIVKADGTTVTIDPAEYDPITSVHNLAFDDDETTVITEEGKLRASMNAFEDILNPDDLDDVIDVQYDPLTNEVFYVEIQADQETKDLFSDFPCTGPFLIASK